MKDFYSVLGTKANCSQDEIRIAYKKLSLKLHPKLYQTDGYHQARFSDVREAFETLNDPSRRIAYDDAFKKYRSYNPQSIPQKLKYTKLTRNIDFAFSFTLIALTLIFGDYVYNSLYKVQPTDVVIHPAVAAVAPVTALSIKHEKRRHGLKIKKTSNNFVQDSALAKPATVADSSSPGYVSISVDKKDNLYEREGNNPRANLVNTYVSTIKPNVTGVVYMRSRDSYNADVINKIPANASVTVLKKGDIFFKILYNNITGFVPKWTIQTR